MTLIRRLDFFHYGRECARSLDAFLRSSQECLWPCLRSSLLPCVHWSSPAHPRSREEDLLLDLISVYFTFETKEFYLHLKIMDMNKQNQSLHENCFLTMF